MEHLVDTLLVEVWEYLLPDVTPAQASGAMRRAAECAGRLIVSRRFGGCAAVEPAAVGDAASWRGLAACWARNTVWLRAAPGDVVRDDGGDGGGGAVASWQDVTPRGPASLFRFLSRRHNRMPSTRS